MPGNEFPAWSGEAKATPEEGSEDLEISGHNRFKLPNSWAQCLEATDKLFLLNPAAASVPQTKPQEIYISIAQPRMIHSRRSFCPLAGHVHD